MTRQKISKRGKVILNRQPLHMQVVVTLREMIVSGRLVGGEKIRVNDLADELDVSLTPLREALKVLAGEKLVELTPNRGARVAPTTPEETEALFEVMAGLEALAAELCAQRMTSDQLAQMQDCHDAMRAHYESGDKPAYFDCNRRIHDMVVEFAGNPILSHSREHLAVRAERVRFLSVALGGRRGEAMQDHEDLMAALRDRDAARAHAVWRRHLIRSGEECCEVLRNGPHPEEMAESQEAQA